MAAQFKDTSRSYPPLRVTVTVAYATLNVACVAVPDWTNVDEDTIPMGLTPVSPEPPPTNSVAVTVPVT